LKNLGDNVGYLIHATLAKDFPNIVAKKKKLVYISFEMSRFDILNFK